jgi:hypothetical protein
MSKPLSITVLAEVSKKYCPNIIITAKRYLTRCDVVVTMDGVEGSFTKKDGSSLVLKDGNCLQLSEHLRREYGSHQWSIETVITHLIRMHRDDKSIALPY